MVRIKNREPVLEAVPVQGGRPGEERPRGGHPAARRRRRGHSRGPHRGRGQPQDQGDHERGPGHGRRRGRRRGRPGARERRPGAAWRWRIAKAVAAKRLDAISCSSARAPPTATSGQVGSRTAELLGVPQIGYARKITPGGDAASQVERSMDDDRSRPSRRPLPVVVTVVSEINEPRIPSLMNIMKAGKKPVTEYTLADLGLDAAAVGPSGDILSNLAEEQDRKRIMLQGGAAEQAEALAERAGQRRGRGEITMADILDLLREAGHRPASCVPRAEELAGALGLGLSAAAFGADAAEVAAELGAHGADTVYVSEDAALDGLPTDVVAEALAQIAGAAGATVRAGRFHAPGQGARLPAGPEAGRGVRHRRRAAWPWRDGDLGGRPVRLRRQHRGPRDGRHRRQGLRRHAQGVRDRSARRRRGRGGRRRAAR